MASRLFRGQHCLRFILATMAGGRQQDATEELRRRIQELEQEIERINDLNESNTTMLENRIYGLKQGKKNESHQSSKDRLDIWEEIDELRNYLEETERSTPTVYYSFYNEGTAQNWTSTIVNAFHAMLGENVNVIPFDSNTPKNAPVFVCHVVASMRLYPLMPAEFYDNLSKIKADRQGIVFVMGLRAVGRHANAAKLEYGPKDEMPLQLIGPEYIEFQFDVMTNFPKELLTSNVEREMERVRECVGISARSSQPMPSALTTGTFRFLQKYLQPAAVHSDISRQPTDDEDVRDINRRLKDQLQDSEESINFFRATIDEQGETIETLRSEINNLTRQMEEVKRDEEETDRSCREFRRKHLSALDTIERLNDELKNPGSTDVYYAPVQQSHTRLADECEDLKRDVANMQQYFTGTQDSTVYFTIPGPNYRKWKDSVADAFKEILGRNVHISMFVGTAPLDAPVFICYVNSSGGRADLLPQEVDDVLQEVTSVRTGKVFLVGIRVRSQKSDIAKLPFSKLPNVEYIEFHFETMGDFPKKLLNKLDDPDFKLVRSCFKPSTGNAPASLTSGRFKFVWDYLQQTALPAAAAPRQENPALAQEITSIKQFFDSAREGIVTVYYVLVQRDRVEKRDDWVKTIQQAFKMILGNGVIVSQFDPNSTPPSAPVFVCDTYWRSRYDYAKRFDMESHLAVTAIEIQKRRKTGPVFLLGLVATTEPGPEPRFTPIPMPNSYPNMEYIELQFNSEGKQHPLPLITRGATLGWQRLSEIIGPVTKRSVCTFCYLFVLF